MKKSICPSWTPLESSDSFPTSGKSPEPTLGETYCRGPPNWAHRKVFLMDSHSSSWALNDLSQFLSPYVPLPLVSPFCVSSLVVVPLVAQTHSVASGSGCSSSLSLTGQRFYHYTSKNSPPPLWFWGDGECYKPWQSTLPHLQMANCFESLISNIPVSHSRKITHRIIRRISWVGRDTQGSLSPTLLWMAPTGFEHTSMVLLALCCDQLDNIYVWVWVFSCMVMQI